MTHSRLLFSYLVFCLATLFVVVGSASPARAAASNWAENQQSRVRLLAGQGESGEAGELELGLQFQLALGWKIYWRSPGDAGFPPSIDWSGSENLAKAEMSWPVPHRFELFGLQTFGYSGEVVLPIEAKVERPGEPARLAAAVNYLICEEICVPHQVALALSLPGGPMTEAAETALIDSYKRMVPGQGAERGLSLERIQLTGTREAPVIEAVARSESAFMKPDLLVEGPPGFIFGKPELSLSDKAHRAQLRVPVSATRTVQGVIDGKALTLTLTDGRRGLEQVWRARFAATPGSQAIGSLTLLTVLGLALLGGLILNLMPCVLPVLSIKLLSVVSHGGKDRGTVRLGFLATAAGVICSFLVLAGVAIALKTVGLAVGWGIQFQQPFFLMAMTIVVSVFAANLFGLFEIPLPRWIGDAVERSDAPGLAGNFLTGAFATLLATPCSAPFLGTAISFALARGPGEILAIFAVLGLGLALPYLLIAAVPQLATRLPKPGRWMILLRRFLGLALAATAVWLLSVIAAQAGALAAATVAFLLLVGVAAVALAKFGWLARRVGAWSAGGALVAAVLALGLLKSPPAVDAAALEEGWEPFDLAKIDQLVEAGEVVFVDVTADWCITCQVNKSIVLDVGRVKERLASPQVRNMRADWTQPDPAISAYLESFGRYGIPFNAVYGPGAPAGLPLPELLNAAAVIEALDRASGVNRTAADRDSGQEG